MRRLLKPSLFGEGGHGSGSRKTSGPHRHASSLFVTMVVAGTLLLLALLFHAKHQQSTDLIALQHFQQWSPSQQEGKPGEGSVPSTTVIALGNAQSRRETATTPVSTAREGPKIKKWGCHLTTTPVIFYHVPKTGGGSVRKGLSQALAGTSIPICWTCVPIPVQQYYYPARTFHEIHSLYPPLLGLPDSSAAAEAWKKGLVMGHYDYGFEYAFLSPPPEDEGGGKAREEEEEEEEEEEPILRVVQLRHPSSRAVSEYLFVKAPSLHPSPSSSSSATTTTNSSSASSLVLASLIPHLQHYDTWVWKRLAQKYQIQNFKSSPCLQGVAIPVIRLCGQTCIPRLIACEMTADQALEKAILNLKRRFAVVGVTEEMGRFFKMLGRRVSYLAKLEGMNLESLRVHESDKGLLKKLKQVMASEEAQRACEKSLAMQQEAKLYAVARQVMQEQWEEELEECGFNGGMNEEGKTEV